MLITLDKHVIASLAMYISATPITPIKSSHYPNALSEKQNAVPRNSNALSIFRNGV